MSLPIPTQDAAIKMASALVHADEALGPYPAQADRSAFQGLIADPDVTDYLDELRALALLPVKR